MNAWIRRSNDRWMGFVVDVCASNIVDWVPEFDGGDVVVESLPLPVLLFVEDWPDNELDGVTSISLRTLGKCRFSSSRASAILPLRMCRIISANRLIDVNDLVE